jgi:hypothetical protein
MRRKCRLHLLLLHQLGIRAVIHHTLPEHGRSERSVNFLCIDVLVFCVQDEIVAFCSQAYCGLLPKQYESEDVSIL